MPNNEPHLPTNYYFRSSARDTIGRSKMTTIEKSNGCRDHLDRPGETVPTVTKNSGATGLEQPSECSSQLRERNESDDTGLQQVSSQMETTDPVSKQVIDDALIHQKEHKNEIEDSGSPQEEAETEQVSAKCDTAEIATVAVTLEDRIKLKEKLLEERHKAANKQKEMKSRYHEEREVHKMMKHNELNIHFYMELEEIKKEAQKQHKKLLKVQKGKASSNI